MRIAAGIMVPNPTFGMLNDSGKPALWSMDSSAANTTTPTYGPTGRGAVRVTKTATTTRKYSSGYSTRAYPVGWASTCVVYGLLWWRSSDGGVGDSVSLSLVQYDASGNDLAVDEQLLSESGASASSTWELSRGSAGITSFSGQQPVFLGLKLTFAGAATWDIAFAAAGIALDGGSPGYYAVTALPYHVPGGGSYGFPMSDSPSSLTARGQAMAMDGDRLLNPYRLQIALESVAATERTTLGRYWMANHNGLFVPSASTDAGVQGGSYPLLVEHELSDTTIPPAMYADWEGEFGLGPWGMDWQPADPYFDGMCSFRERVYR